MRIFLTLCFTVALTALCVENSSAQQLQRSVRASERVARASWQPTRPRTEQQSAATSGGTVRESLPLSNRLRQVDHIEVENVPVPPTPEPEVSIIEPPVTEPAPLDGQINLAPVHDGTVACDAVPIGECGCDDAYCLGDCGGGGCCDSVGSCCGSAGCSTCGELCSDNAWRPCVTLCLPQDGWATFEYLRWYQDGLSLPPLVTTSVDPNVDRGLAGVLGAPTTQVLVGGGDVLDNGINGGRLRIGVWLDRCHTWGIGGEFLQMGRKSASFVGTSSGNPILARPFFNTQTGVEDSELVAFPNVVSGTVGVTARSRLVGGGFHFRHLRCCDEGCSKWLFCGCPEHFCSRTEVIFGYRGLQLDEDVTITENLVSTDTANPGTFDIIDRFQTRNQFDGFDIGWMYRRTRGFWTFDTLVRLAIGNTRQTVTIAGQTTINDPQETPQIQTLPGGLLTQTSNIGTYRRNEFAVVPELNLNVGYQLTDHIRVILGYTGIYWSNVVRPGDQISRDVNPALLPPPADPFTGAQRPAFAFDNTDYWAQAINIGGEYRW